MTQEEKSLLLIDLSARLPYGVQVLADVYKTFDGGIIGKVVGVNEFLVHLEEVLTPFLPDEIRPYLRPMSSMTEDEREEFRVVGGIMSHNLQNDSWVISVFTPEAYDWLNAHHFDYRGLIEKGLAIEVTEDNNPYEN